MIIRTRHSTYRLTQEGTKMALIKIEDHFPGPGAHPGTKVGDVFYGANPKPPVVGKSFWLKGDWGTSEVISVEPEPGDGALCFAASDAA